MARKEGIARLQQVLVKRRDALRKALAGDLSLLQELSSESSGGDAADVAMDTSQDEINSQLAEVESRELEMIQTALERMEAGTYGQCEACDKPIPMARLNALPYATLCIECQREEEEYGETTRRARPARNRAAETDESNNNTPINDLEIDVS